LKAHRRAPKEESPSNRLLSIKKPIHLKRVFPIIVEGLNHDRASKKPHRGLGVGGAWRGLGSGFGGSWEKIDYRLGKFLFSILLPNYFNRIRGRASLLL
jgi:hypothetical protein